MPSKAAPTESKPTATPVEAKQAGTTESGQETGVLAADIQAALGLDRTDEETGDDDESADATPEDDGDDAEAADDETADEGADETEADAEADEADEAEPETDAKPTEDDKADEPDDEEKSVGDDDAEPQEGGKWPKGTPDWARREITQLRAELRELKGKTGQESSAANEPDLADNPLLGAGNESELAGLEERYAGYEEFADETLAAMAGEGWKDRDDEGEPVVKVEGKTFTKAQLEQVRRNAKRVLRQAPRVRQFIAAREQSAHQARTEYPWLGDEKDARTKAHAVAKKSLPWLRNVWNADMIVADAIVGQRLREARSKGREKGAAKGEAEKPVKPAAKPAAGTPAPAQNRPAPKPDARMVRATRAAERLEAEGSTDALTDLVESKFGGL